METDRAELRDLAAQMPDKARQLAQMYEQWAARVGVRDWQELLHLGGFEKTDPARATPDRK